jgi:hypothetical protein
VLNDLGFHLSVPTTNTFLRSPSVATHMLMHINFVFHAKLVLH